jgi:hypothetical protein
MAGLTPPSLSTFNQLTPVASAHTLMSLSHGPTGLLGPASAQVVRRIALHLEVVMATFEFDLDTTDERDFPVLLCTAYD